jgi:hypothetical protein
VVFQGETVTDVLDLDGIRPPGPPKRQSVQLGFRVIPSVAAWVRQRARDDRVNPAQWLARLIEREMRGRDLPADCRAWLVMQAAQCGFPGDPDLALIAVLRHLADRWPIGARLSPETAESLSEQLSTTSAELRAALTTIGRLEAALERHERR